MHINTQGIVIKAINFGDNDKLLTVLTNEYGKITVLAKGAKNLKSRFGPSSNLFAYSNLILFKNKNKYSLDKAELVELFYNLRNDIKKLSLAQYFAEIIALLSVENNSCKEILSFFLNTLYILANKDKSFSMVKAVFELRVLSYAGYMPELCGCERFDGTKGLLFSIKEGCLHCGSCGNFLNKDCIEINEGLLSALNHIICSEDSKLYSFTMPEKTLNYLSLITERYLLMQLEHSFATLDFYNTIKGE